MDDNQTARFELKLSDNNHELAYLRLPTYPKDNNVMRVSKSLRLYDLIGAYTGPDVLLDFDEDGVLVGIEIITDDFTDE